MISFRSLAFLLAVILTLPATTALAFDDDEMTFSPEDLEEDDDDSMTFAPDDLQDDDFDPEDDRDQAHDVGVVAIPNDDITAHQRDDIQAALRRAVDEIPDITTYGDRDLLPGLEDRDPDYCSRESLCLAGVGRSAGVQRIVQARVERDRGDFRLDIDYFDVDDRLFVAYHSNSGLSDIEEVIEAIPDGVNDIFGIRGAPTDDPYVDVSDVNVQRIAAYFAGGASALSLGIGTIFGLRVSSRQSELDEEFARDSQNRYTGLTQQEARSMQRDMESQATIANFGIGAGVVLAAGSVLLFILSSDDEPEMDLDARAKRTFTIAPSFDDNGAGFGASWRF